MRRQLRIVRDSGRRRRCCGTSRRRPSRAHASSTRFASRTAASRSRRSSRSRTASAPRASSTSRCVEIGSRPMALSRWRSCCATSRAPASSCRTGRMPRPRPQCRRRRCWRPSLMPRGMGPTRSQLDSSARSCHHRRRPSASPTDLSCRCVRPTRRDRTTPITRRTRRSGPSAGRSSRRQRRPSLVPSAIACCGRSSRCRG